MTELKQEIFIKIQSILVELFELDKDKIVPEAKLYDDLDIDSIDTVDMMIELKKYGPSTMSPEQFKHVQTLQDVIDVLAGAPE